ncbi:hypothetical protein VSH64_11555 [Amycolatopsis rhabdoformis]|uniref:Phage holin family protein n=1 Tax=Amycolatopsis rhabdoformis TaxID=1448059 RepID=A0ABZ1IG96_9PSEU|nr:hypothetical protein [Amycolatopsis rhabdoformis]WSE32738.1 hypothetical protein VSH64_11555 [Amycolatopsis rhabdoformis]
MTTLGQDEDLTFLKLLDRVLASAARTTRALALVRTCALCATALTVAMALLAFALGPGWFTRIVVASATVLTAGAGGLVAVISRARKNQRRTTTASPERNSPPTEAGPE